MPRCSLQSGNSLFGDVLIYETTLDLINGLLDVGEWRSEYAPMNNSGHITVVRSSEQRIDVRI